MSIFKKASVTPIVKTVVSYGLDDYDHPDPSMEDAELYHEINLSYEKDNNKIKQLIDELNQEGRHEDAFFCRSMMNEGYGFNQIRDMLSSIRSFRKNP